MSNLWFFRLKRAEQQRRRSSGEQSVGSASIHSAAGGSAASLPLVNQPSVDSSGTESELAIAGQQQQQQHFDSPRFSLAINEFDVSRNRFADETNATALWQNTSSSPVSTTAPVSVTVTTTPTRPASASDSQANRRTVCDSDETRSSNQRGVFKSPFPPRVKQSSNHHQQLQDQNSKVHLKHQRRKLSERQSKVEEYSLEMDRWPSENQHQPNNPPTLQRQPVPQVTIIRSDSTSSFIPVMVQETPEAANCGQFSPRPLVSDFDPAKGSVENRCLMKGDLFEINPQYNQRVSLEKQDSKNQEELMSNTQNHSDDQNERRTSGTSSEFKRGIHEHLVSGKVPPIRERGLLNPHSGKAGLNLADSLDNLASLIPR